MCEKNKFDFKTVLELSKLKPKDSDEEQELKSSFSKILKHVEVIVNKDLKDESNNPNLEMTHVHADINALREDHEDDEDGKINKNMDNETGLMNAPDARDRYFVTPLIIPAKKDTKDE